MPKNVEELANWYMRYVSPLALVAGFLADNYILLRRVDLWTSNALLFSYLFLAALCIVVMNLITTGRLRWKWLLTVTPLIPVVAQFAFGGLFSGYLSLYSRSATFAASWIFVVLVAALLIGNERFVKLYMRFSFQISMFFAVLFTFLIFFLPVTLHRVGPYMFLLSGATSVLLIVLFLRFVGFLMPEILERERTRTARSIAGIFVLLNVLYFSNAIPPLPLALKDAGIYHAVILSKEGTYRLFAEPTPWYDEYLPTKKTFHYAAGEDAYLFSAVFAPTGISTTILHEWQRYDADAGRWVTHSTIKFPIVGGRDGGHRGYSFIKDISAGKWRVNVITQYGQLIGRIAFTVVEVPASVPVVELQS